MKSLAPTGTLLVLGVGLLALAGLSCHQGKPAAAPGPAVEKPKAEGELAFATLAQDEVKSLQIATNTVTPQPVQARLELTGWVTPRQNHEVVVKAPVAGYLLDAGKDFSPPLPGQQVKTGQLLFRLDPVLSPLEAIQYASLKVGVETDLEKAREALALGQQDYEDMKGLVESKVKPKQDLDRARVRLRHAEEDYKLAQERQKLLQVPDIDIKAKRAGTVAVVHVNCGEYVPLAAPLVTVIDLDSVWVRVPLPEEDLPRLDRKQDAEVILRTTKTGGKGADKTPAFRATPVAVVPVVDPTRHTIDLIYELQTPPGGPALRDLVAKDLMVTVHVPLGQKQTESVVPYSAVIFDAHGGAWVYLDRGAAKSGKQQYERRRVEVGARVGDGVVVRPTLTANERVVTFGAGVLFSREFYKPPVNP